MGAPSGTVTFLFTDIEGSTRLWQEDEPSMREAVRRHDELLQATILECGGESNETEAVSRRHAQYYQAFAAAADPGLRGPDEVSWTEQVERDLDNLRAAVSWAVEAGEADTALGIIASLAIGFGTRIGAPFGAISERAVAMPEALEHPLRGVALASAARSARDRGEHDRARLLAEEALEAAAALPPGRASAHARCRTISGVLVVLFPDIVLEAQDISRFRDLSERRLVAAIELDDDWEKALALMQTAGLFLYGEPARGIADAEAALRLARRLDNPSALIYAPITLGSVLADTDPGRAETLFDEAIRTASVLQNNFAEITAHQSLGRARTLHGDHLKAATPI
jgi:class 3 adenylate cyclase